MSLDASKANKNLGVINTLTSRGVTLESAVTQTWTAGQAAKYGFTTPTIQVVKGMPGTYTKIEVIFSKSP